jgi:rod shape-determining protein MreC
MRRNNHWLFLIVTILGIYLVCGGENVLFLRNRLLSFALGSTIPSELDNLKNHNLELEAQLLNLKIGNEDKEERKQLTAKVYSLYPFANRSEIVINKGLNAGIKEGMAVVIENKVMVGKVKTVYGTSSVVQTIFDKNSKMPVRIGETETDAFYDGGLTAKLSLIDSKSLIKEEDLVLAADKDLPYGLVLGRIMNITDASPLKEARLQPIYELKNLRNVVVIFD